MAYNKKEFLKKLHRGIRIDKLLMEIKKVQEKGCPVCKHGWKVYHGDYDGLCTKHYLQIEPTK